MNKKPYLTPIFRSIILNFEDVLLANSGEGGGTGRTGASIENAGWANSQGRSIQNDMWQNQ